jgi:hypothetical protein
MEGEWSEITTHYLNLCNWWKFVWIWRQKLLGLISIDKGFLWILVYVVTISILWSIAALLTSIPLVQFFFLREISLHYL